MNQAVSEVLEFLRENDVKFVKLAFCDLFGAMKNVAIVSQELPAAFKNGVSFDAHSIKGFRDATESDLFLFPDPRTLTTLPWRPGPGRVVRFFCDIKNPDGSPFRYDARNILRNVEQRCLDLGFSCKVGAECEFYLFKTDEFAEPSENTIDKGEYFDIAPLDKGENIRREICLTLEEMGINPESSHHERGPGQNEIDFKFSSPLNCADNFMTFKSVVKMISSRNGTHASFMPKPIAETAGNGMHINLSLSQDGKNIFENIGKGQSKAAESFIAGILSKTPEMTVFLNPIINSYERFGEFEAPKYVSWSHQNRSQLVRIPAANDERGRMELRSPDPSLNPYLAFALILSAGLDGIENDLKLADSLDVDLYSADDKITGNLACLPENLTEAVYLAQRSDFVKKTLGEDLLSKYLAVKKEEAKAFALCADKKKFYKDKYFDVL